MNDGPAGLRLRLAGEEVVCRRSGALWIEAARMLVVADLHLEKGSAYAARGQMLPPFDTVDALGRLEAEVADAAPSTIVFLGDSFHDVAALARLEASATKRVRAISAAARLIWIEGNHDRAVLGALPGEALAELRVGSLLLVHEPAGFRGLGEVAGHLHPCAKVRSAAGALRRRCFVTDGRRIVLPAFGAYAGGLNVLDRAFRTLFQDRPLAAVIGEKGLHLMPSRSLAPD
ncbi:MAG: ligase-associated DNA damage response endonuclease PdeM [Caulobacteraceae bacterium]